MTDAFPDDSRRTGPALEKTYQLLFWLMPTVEKFPRSYKFVLGDRIQTGRAPAKPSRAAVCAWAPSVERFWIAASLRSTR